MTKITKIVTSPETLLAPGEGLKKLADSQGQEQKLMLEAHRASAALKEFQIKKKLAAKPANAKKTAPKTAATSRRIPKKSRGA